MTQEKEYLSEKEELNKLIGRGVSFEVERKVKAKVGRKYLFFNRYIEKTEKLKFVVNEPTLSVLDRISAEQIELRIDENIMSTDAGISEAKKLTNQHSRRFAKIIAIAVLGQDYVKTIQDGVRVRYEYDNSKLEELTELFLNCIQPSKLLQLVLMINTISNLGDFTNSIRLMSASRTTMPIRIEESNED